MKATTALCLIWLLVAGCNRPAREVTGPLPQRGYLWQRAWTPAVIGAVAEAQGRLDGIVILGGEVIWVGNRPELVRANVDWDVLKARSASCSIALRVAPYAGPFVADDAATRFVVGVAKELIDEARTHGVKINEFQFDFDCAQKNLGGYRTWLQILRSAIRPVRFVITTLPAWLDEPEFVPLVREVDGYVLQVHSVPILSADGRPTLCDASSAQKWASRAAKMGLPFAIALPTYRCIAGYDRSGKCLGVAMDGVQPVWPPDTRTLEVAANADDMATLVHEWQRARPPELQELLWYRLPVTTDVRNWRWPTLSAVMAGRKPRHHIEVLQEGENPIDLSIANTGEADEQLDSVVTATWSGSALVASDALRGWRVDHSDGCAIFSTTAGRPLRLPPGRGAK